MTLESDGKLTVEPACVDGAKAMGRHDSGCRRGNDGPRRVFTFGDDFEPPPRVDLIDHDRLRAYAREKAGPAGGKRRPGVSDYEQRPPAGSLLDASAECCDSATEGGTDSCYQRV